MWLSTELLFSSALAAEITQGIVIRCSLDLISKKLPPSGDDLSGISQRLQEFLRKESSPSHSQQ